MTTRQTNPFRPGYGRKANAERWNKHVVAKLFEEPRATDTEPMALLRKLLATLPDGHQDRPGVIRSIEVLQYYPKKAEA